MNTPYAKLVAIVPLAIGALGVSFAHAQQVATASGDVKWINAPASLPRGAKLAMMEGDLGKAGPLTFRLRLPAGYQLKPHSSPAIDRIVVVSGALNLGSGEKFDRKRTMPLYSGYVHWPQKSPYFAFTKEETIVEFQGAGPFTVTYVNPADDPMKKKQLSSSAMQ